MSEIQSQLGESVINFELQLMEEASSLLGKFSIPNSLRYCHVMYKRPSKNPLSESEKDDELLSDRRLKKKMTIVIVLLPYGMNKMSMLYLPKISTIKSTRGLVKFILNQFPKFCHIKVTQEGDLIQSKEIEIRIM